MKRRRRLRNRLTCFRCGRHFGNYERAATILLELYCPVCKGNVCFEAKDGELVGCRFDPKEANPGDTPSVGELTP